MMGTQHSWLKTVADAVLRGGVKNFHSVEAARKIIMIHIITIIGIANLIPLGINAFSVGSPYLGIFDLFVAAILIVQNIYLRITGDDKTSSHIGTALAGGLFFYLYVTGGVAGSGHVWLFTFPLFSSFLLGAKRGAVATCILMGTALGFPLVFGDLSFVMAYSAPFTLRLSMAVLVTFSFAYFFEWTRSKTQGTLENKNVELRDKIAQLKATENALKDSEEIYRRLVEGANDGIALIQGRRIEYLNPQMADLIGYSVEHIQGSAWTEFTDPAEEEKLKELTRRKMSGEPTPTHYETSLRHKNGEVIDVEFSANVLTFRGEPAVLVFIRDIREQKLARLRLSQAKEAAENANKAKSIFLANMSHELRTPLNHIMGFTELVMNLENGNLTDQQTEYLTDVLSSSHHLLSLINDILDLSKIEAGKIELEPSPTDIRALIEGSLVMVQEKAMKCRIALSVHIEDFPDHVNVDRRKIKQVMYNLLSNAVKFTPPGGSIGVSGGSMSRAEIGRLCEQGAVQTSIPEILGDRDWIQIAVEDSGEGIEEGCLSLIFHPFEQLEKEEGKTCEGTGLGLSLTKTLVELHGGCIWAESEGKGKGATFRFILPVLSERDLEALRQSRRGQVETKNALSPGI